MHIYHITHKVFLACTIIGSTPSILGRLLCPSQHNLLYALVTCAPPHVLQASASSHSAAGCPKRLHFMHLLQLQSFRPDICSTDVQSIPDHCVSAASFLKGEDGIGRRSRCGLAQTPPSDGFYPFHFTWHVLHSVDLLYFL